MYFFTIFWLTVVFFDYSLPNQMSVANSVSNKELDSEGFNLFLYPHFPCGTFLWLFYYVIPMSPNTTCCRIFLLDGGGKSRKMILKQYVKIILSIASGILFTNFNFYYPLLVYILLYPSHEDFFKMVSPCWRHTYPLCWYQLPCKKTLSWGFFLER